MRRYAPWLMLSAGLLAGCASFHALPVTHATIARDIVPGDTVRVRLAGDPAELTMRISSVDPDALQGRIQGAPDAELTRIGFDRIEQLEVARPNLRKAILTTVLPVLIAAAIVCNQQDCQTHAVVTATY